MLLAVPRRHAHATHAHTPTRGLRATGTVAPRRHATPSRLRGSFGQAGGRLARRSCRLPRRRPGRTSRRRRAQRWRVARAAAAQPLPRHCHRPALRRRAPAHAAEHADPRPARPRLRAARPAARRADDDTRRARLAARAVGLRRGELARARAGGAVPGLRAARVASAAPRGLRRDVRRVHGVARGRLGDPAGGEHRGHGGAVLRGRRRRLLLLLVRRC